MTASLTRRLRWAQELAWLARQPRWLVEEYARRVAVMGVPERFEYEVRTLVARRVTGGS